MLELNYPNPSSTASAFQRQDFVSGFQQKLGHELTPDPSDNQAFVILHKDMTDKHLESIINNQVLQFLKQTDLPILIVPNNHVFKGIKKICFVGYAPLLSDHALLHQIAAAFLPRAHRVKKNQIIKVHWNNVFQMPRGILTKYFMSPENLNTSLQDNEMDLVIMPLSQKKPWWRSVWEMSFLAKAELPVLVFPV